MRMFQSNRLNGSSAPVYCCQDDGMVGLGAGARSYTRKLHYSGNFAVERTNVLSIIDRYIASSDDEFGHAHHGFKLSLDEEKRRFVIQSLLQFEGLLLDKYQERFGSNPIDDLQVLVNLLDAGLCEKDFAGGRLVLTAAGISLSDAISDELYSPSVKQLMASCDQV